MAVRSRDRWRRILICRLVVMLSARRIPIRDTSTCNSDGRKEGRKKENQRGDNSPPSPPPVSPPPTWRSRMDERRSNWLKRGRDPPASKDAISLRCPPMPAPINHRYPERTLSDGRTDGRPMAEVFRRRPLRRSDLAGDLAPAAAAEPLRAGTSEPSARTADRRSPSIPRRRRLDRVVRKRSAVHIPRQPRADYRSNRACNYCMASSNSVYSAV